jgi:hypothetical protein
MKGPQNTEHVNDTLNCLVRMEENLELWPALSNENPIYVYPEKELRALSSNFHIHVFVSDLYVSRIGPHTVFPAAEKAD